MIQPLVTFFPLRQTCLSHTSRATAWVQVMGGLRQQWVQRQGCMALRNLVARNPEARPLLLEKGAEEALRRAKLDFPAACRDVGSAALRDLGVEDYNS